MLRQLAYSAAAKVEPGQDRRTRGRVRQQGVMSNVGVVIDLSGGGVRILSTHALEGELDLSITCDTDSVSMKAQVVWSKRVGFRRHVVGLRFLNLDEAALRTVSRIAANHRVQVAV
jgi:hypothetical protein